jgi:hypothetical protein
MSDNKLPFPVMAAKRLNLKRKDVEQAIRLGKKMAEINNAMKVVKRHSGVHHSIKIHGEYSFRVLVLLEDIFKNNRSMAGRSWSFHLPYCTIGVKRNMQTK